MNQNEFLLRPQLIDQKNQDLDVCFDLKTIQPDNNSIGVPSGRSVIKPLRRSASAQKTHFLREMNRSVLRASRREQRSSSAERINQSQMSSVKTPMAKHHFSNFDRGKTNIIQNSVSEKSHVQAMKHQFLSEIHCQKRELTK